MAAAIWMIMYDLDPAQADRYLHWFDEVHIPEKLARPGYTWAAHYQVVDADSAPRNRYIALFGGSDSRVFYDPSPAQIKPTQPADTRAMMAHRSNSQMLILSLEWCVIPDEACAPGESRIDSDWLRLVMCNSNGNDEDLGAWLVQDYVPGLDAATGVHKYLVSSGDPAHVLLQTLPAVDDLSAGFAEATSGDWAQRVANYLTFPLGTALVARRIWPSP